MLMKTRHATWIGHLLVVVFLLSSVSVPNASFWCQDTESSAHLVSSPVGTCQVISPATKNQQLCGEEIERTGEFLSIPSIGCFDFPVLSSISTTNHSTSPSRITAPPLEVENIPFTPGDNSRITPFADRSLALQLPSLQALTSLRTIILLR